MIFSDRRLNSVVAGLVLMGAVSGCRSTARYQTAEQSTGATTYAGTPVAPRNSPIPEPPSAFGPREPVPMTAPDEPYESPAPEPIPEDVPSARSYDLSPALRSVPDESPVDEDLRFPEANRRTKPSRSLRAMLSASRQKSGIESRTATEKTHPSSVSRAKKNAGVADNRATAKLVALHSDAPAQTMEQPRKPELEPVLLSDLPSLVPPPATAVARTGIERQELRIERIALCNEVRGYDDVAQIDPQRINRNDHFLVYVSLQNYRSRVTENGFQTLTRSQVELRTLSGEVVWRQALGNANDFAARPRHQYFLAHEIAIPPQIPAGNYVLSLRVEDILSEESVLGQVAVRLHGGS